MKNTFCVFVVFYYFILEIFSVFKALRQQIRGIEPPSPAWEAGILPMNYICDYDCIWVL